MHDRSPEIPARGRPRGNFCWQQNELYDLFQPIIGATAHLIYTHLTRKAFDAKFRCSVRELARRTGLSHSTVSRALAVLESVGLLRVRAGGGNRASEIELVDLESLARRLGATHNKRTGMFGFPEETVDHLRAVVAKTQQKLQGKRKDVNAIQTIGEGSTDRQSLDEGGGPSFFSLSERDTSVLPERHQGCTRETQTGSQQIKRKQNTRKQPIPYPFPRRRFVEKQTRF